MFASAKAVPYLSFHHQFDLVSFRCSLLLVLRAGHIVDMKNYLQWFVGLLRADVEVFRSMVSRTPGLVAFDPYLNGCYSCNFTHYKRTFVTHYWCYWTTQSIKWLTVLIVLLYKFLCVYYFLTRSERTIINNFFNILLLTFSLIVFCWKLFCWLRWYQCVNIERKRMGRENSAIFESYTFIGYVNGYIQCLIFEN